MALNRNNFLRWEGSFTNKTFTIVGGTLDIVHLYSNEDSCTVDPFTGGSCSASNGINPYSLTIKVVDISNNPVELSHPCEYNGDTQILTIFRPIDLSILTFYIIFSWSDYMGNESIGGLGVQNVISVVVSAVSVEWVEYPVSDVCLLDGFGNNTGYRSWSQLKLQNSATHTDISPLTLKDNVPGDYDYQPPVLDAISCPSPSLPYSPLFISNFSKNGSDLGNYITITNVLLTSSTLGPSGTPISFNLACSIAPGMTQRFNVPSGAWTSGGLTLSYSVTGNMATASPQRYWRYQIGGVVGYYPNPPGTPSAIDNSGIYGNFDITVPVSGSGITVFAQ